MFKEFPKCLIQGESSIVVFDAAQEEVARADGFKFHDEIGEPEKLIDLPDDPEKAPVVERKKPGRKPKAE